MLNKNKKRNFSGLIYLFVCIQLGVLNVKLDWWRSSPLCYFIGNKRFLWSGDRDRQWRDSEKNEINEPASWWWWWKITICSRAYEKDRKIKIRGATELLPGSTAASSQPGVLKENEKNKIKRTDKFFFSWSNEREEATERSRGERLFFPPRWRFNTLRWSNPQIVYIWTSGGGLLVQLFSSYLTDTIAHENIQIFYRN